MKITKNYLRTVIKEELERLDETTIGQRGNVAVYLKRLVDQAITLSKTNEIDDDVKELIDTWNDAANQKKFAQDYGHSKDFKYVFKNLETNIELLAQYLERSGKGNYINPSKYDGSTGNSLKQKIHVREAAKTEPSARSISPGHMKALKRFGKVNPGMRSNDIVQHNAGVQQRQEGFVSSLKHISDLLTKLIGGQGHSDGIDYKTKSTARGNY